MPGHHLAPPSQTLREWGLVIHGLWFWFSPSTNGPHALSYLLCLEQSLVQSLHSEYLLNEWMNECSRGSEASKCSLINGQEHKLRCQKDSLALQSCVTWSLFLSSLRLHLLREETLREWPWGVPSSRPLVDRSTHMKQMNNKMNISVQYTVESQLELEPHGPWL